MGTATEYDVVIIGAGPAGLTAALELQRAGVRRIAVVEADKIVGGISRTVNKGGNRIDIGGHRFFSKSDWVMNWWATMLPLQVKPGESVFLQYQGQSRDTLPPMQNAQAGDEDEVMLVRNRLSRIYYNRQFFDYPLKLNGSSLGKLGLKKTITFGLSYIWAQLRPVTPEASLQDFLVNRFGRKLYRQFFKEYTEKVWGVPCSEISADWGAQRIKSLSVTKALLHAARKTLRLEPARAAQTSLIESFMYPKHGPGQMWETVARRLTADGGTLLMEHRATRLEIDKGVVTAVVVRSASGDTLRLNCANVISTMPIKDLVAASSGAWTSDAEKIAANLAYRDFFTVGLLYDKRDVPRQLNDNWIYIQEPGVNVGRVQVFNNWSPGMVADPETVWLGLEFFSKETDALWQMSDDDLQTLAQRELQQIGLVSASAAKDAIVLRVPKAYPGYFGDAYAEFDTLRAELDAVANLFLVGRNGMHRYNNQDHSMLTAKEAVDQIVSGAIDKSRIWAINVDDEYHEEKSRV
jgi:protoporphyrinogen oxidase